MYLLFRVAAVCVCWAFALSALAQAEDTPPTLPASNALRLAVYIMADTVQRLCRLEDERMQAVENLRNLEVNRVYLEGARGDALPTREELTLLRDLFQSAGFETAGGIATVAGKNFGIKQKDSRFWLFYEATKTREDIAAVMRLLAELFDTVILDDFFCTADCSDISTRKKRSRSWAQYRCDLMAELGKSIIMEPAKQTKSTVHVIIKFPQWYDLFHVFGYDVPRHVQNFDSVWVGTEARGATTQRYGYTQSYQSFVNFTYIRAIGGEKVRGAWFDHGDCTADDYLDQAYQSVLAGAQELVLFHYGNIAAGDPGDRELKAHLPTLRALAESVRQNPVQGPPAYKVPNADAGADKYLFDYLGMMGIPVQPVVAFPNDAPVIFLATHAAADPDIADKVKQTVDHGGKVIVTPGFLANVRDRENLCNLAGVAPDFTPQILEVSTVLDRRWEVPLETPLRLGARLPLTQALPVLEALSSEGERLPFLTKNPVGSGHVYVLNVMTFQDEDFTRMKELLLPPVPLRLTTLPQPWLNTLREAFSPDGKNPFNAPGNVIWQPMGAGGWYLQNNNTNGVTVVLDAAYLGALRMQDRIHQRRYAAEDKNITVFLGPRERAWLQPLP